MFILDSSAITGSWSLVRPLSTPNTFTHPATAPLPARPRLVHLPHPARQPPSPANRVLLRSTAPCPLRAPSASPSTINVPSTDDAGALSYVAFQLRQVLLNLAQLAQLSLCVRSSCCLLQLPSSSIAIARMQRSPTFTTEPRVGKGRSRGLILTKVELHGLWH